MNHLIVLGWTGYAALVVLTALLIDSARRDPRYTTVAGSGAAWMSLLSVSAVIFLLASGAAPMHAWWIIPAVLVAGIVISGIGHHEPPILYPLIRGIAWCWMKLVRAGVRPITPRQARAVALLEDIRHHLHGREDRSRQALHTLCTQFPAVMLRLRELRGEITLVDAVECIDAMLNYHRHGTASEFLLELTAPESDGAEPNGASPSGNPREEADEDGWFVHLAIGGTVIEENLDDADALRISNRGGHGTVFVEKRHLPDLVEFMRLRGRGPADRPELWLTQSLVVRQWKKGFKLEDTADHDDCDDEAEKELSRVTLWHADEDEVIGCLAALAPKTAAAA